MLTQMVCTEQLNTQQIQNMDLELELKVMNQEWRLTIQVNNYKN